MLSIKSEDDGSLAALSYCLMAVSITRWIRKHFPKIEAQITMTRFFKNRLSQPLCPERHQATQSTTKMNAEKYLTRQPIIDRHHQIIAYELLFQHSEHPADQATKPDQNTHLDVIGNALYGQKEDWLLKDKLIFIEMNEELLMSDFRAQPPANKVVIKLPKTIRITPALIQRIAELHRLGYRFSTGVYALMPEFESILPFSSYITLDIGGLSAERMTAIVDNIKRHPVKIIAEQVHEFGTYKAIESIRFDFFQGYYCAHPEHYTNKTINPSQTLVLDLMNKVRGDADIRQIEDAFKRDVALTFKLLRYINSAGFGLSCEVQSIRHAVSILGMKPLYRWLNLLLATASNKPTASALTRIAVTRGRLCELLGRHHMAQEDQDNLFITGVFSLLDAIMEMPMAEILARIALPENVSEALLNYSGLYGPTLELAIASEDRRAKQIEALTESLFLTPEQFNTANLQALAWVEEVGLDG
jgi:EAL and modified HD-GYP domain-containing signal transduction protein